MPGPMSAMMSSLTSDGANPMAQPSDMDQDQDNDSATCPNCGTSFSPTTGEVHDDGSQQDPESPMGQSLGGRTAGMPGSGGSVSGQMQGAAAGKPVDTKPHQRMHANPTKHRHMDRNSKSDSTKLAEYEKNRPMRLRGGGKLPHSDTLQHMARARSRFHPSNGGGY
jgi:hypothetical protein